MSHTDSWYSSGDTDITNPPQLSRTTEREGQRVQSCYSNEGFLHGVT